MYEDGEISDNLPSEHTRYRSPDRRYKSSDRRHKSPDPRYKSPDPRYRSPDPRYNSPDPRYKSSDTQYKSPDARCNSPDTKRRSSDLKYKSRDPRYLSHTKPSSSDHQTSHKYPRSAEESSPDIHCSAKSPELKHKIVDKIRSTCRHSTDSRGSRPQHTSRSPLATSREFKPIGTHKPSSIEAHSRVHSRSPHKSQHNTDSTNFYEQRKSRANSADYVTSIEEFENVISNIKTEMDDTPNMFYKNFEDAIEKEFSSEINKAICYLMLRFQVILESKFDKTVLEDEDRKKIMERLQGILKKRIKKMSLNRFMLEMDIVSVYKNMYTLNDDTALIRKLMEDVSFVEIVDDEDAKSTPQDNVDSKMWFIVDDALNGLDVNALRDDDAQTVRLDRIKEEQLENDRICIKTEPLTELAVDPNITIQTESTAVTPTPEVGELPIRIKTEPADENDMPHPHNNIVIKQEPYDPDDPSSHIANQPEVPRKKKVKKTHIRKVFDYPDISLKPIPDNPQFYITTKNVSKVMKRYIPVVSAELNLCLSATDTLIVSDLIKEKLRKKIIKLLKNKTYMRSPEITKLFREHHPTEVDRKFVKKVLKSFKKGPKPPKAKKGIKQEKQESESDSEVKVVEDKQLPIVLDEVETESAITVAPDTEEQETIEKNEL